jgi:hypothetical protein
MFIMLITLLFMAITGGISVSLALFAPWWLGYSILLLFVTAISVSLYLWILTLAEKKYRQYEL